MARFTRNAQYYKFCAYGFLKNLRFFEIVFLLFLKGTGISYLQIGLLYSIRQITINLLEIPSGLVADVLGRKRALLFALFSYIVSFILFYLSRHYLLLAFAMIAFGTGEAFRSGTHKAMILDYLKINHIFEQKSRFYGSTRSWSQFGSAVSSLLAVAIIFYSGRYRMLFLLATLPYLLDLILIATYPAELNGNTHLQELSLFNKFKDSFLNFIALFKDKTLIRGLFSDAGYVAFYKGGKDYLQPILKLSALSLPFLVGFSQQKRTALLLGAVYFFIFLMTSFASRNAWKVESYLNSLIKAINRSYLSGIISVGVAGLFYHFGFIFPAAAIFIILYLIQNIRRPLMVSYLSEIISSTVMASGMSAASQLETVLVALYAPLLGFLIDVSGLGLGLLFSSLLFLLLFPFSKLSR